MLRYRSILLKRNKKGHQDIFYRHPKTLKEENLIADSTLTQRQIYILLGVFSNQIGILAFMSNRRFKKYI